MGQLLVVEVIRGRRVRIPLSGFHDIRVQGVRHVRPGATHRAATSLGGRAEDKLFVLALGTSDTMHRFVKAFDQVCSSVKLGFVGPVAATELVHPFGRFRWAVGPFLTLLVEEVDVPRRPP